MSEQKLNRSFIHESNLIEGFDSKAADEALARAWGNLKKRPHIYHSTILTAQETATSHQDIPDIWRGRYRSSVGSARQGNSGRVMINGIEAPNPTMVDRLMEDWLEQYGDPKKDFSPIVAHIAFEKIHPFMDGNGRVGRLILWWHEKQKGLPFTKFTNDTKDMYYRWFQG